MGDWLLRFWEANSSGVLVSLATGFLFFVLGPIGVWFSGRRIRMERRRRASRHGSNSGFKNVSRFTEGTSVRQLRGYVDEALRYGDVTPNGPNGFQIEHAFGRTIGSDRAGNAATGIRVIVRDGIIQTAFPIP